MRLVVLIVLQIYVKWVQAEVLTWKIPLVPNLGGDQVNTRELSSTSRSVLNVYDRIVYQTSVYYMRGQYHPYRCHYDAMTFIFTSLDLLFYCTGKHCESHGKCRLLFRICTLMEIHMCLLEMKLSGNCAVSGGFFVVTTLIF